MIAIATGGPATMEAGGSGGWLGIRGRPELGVGVSPCISDMLAHKPRNRGSYGKPGSPGPSRDCGGAEGKLGRRVRRVVSDSDGEGHTWGTHGVRWATDAHERVTYSRCHRGSCTLQMEIVPQHCSRLAALPGQTVPLVRDHACLARGQGAGSHIYTQATIL